jgi:plasmid maintenance system antidote protein VapI
VEHMEHLVQTRIVTLGAVAPMEWVSDVYIMRCRSEKDAIALCWAKRNRKGLTLRQAAEELRIQPSHLSNILSGKKYLPHDFRIRFQELCGNWAIRQYEDLRCGFRTEKETPEQRRIRQLEAQLSEVSRAA